MNQTQIKKPSRHTQPYPLNHFYIPCKQNGCDFSNEENKAFYQTPSMQAKTNTTSC